jgi:uncharacterized protein (TIGR02246 family)
MNIHSPACRALLFATTLACVPVAHAAVPADAKTEIEKFNADWGPAMQKGDADGVMAPYAPDAVFCTGDGKCYTGFDAIAAMTKTRFAAHGPAKSAVAHTTQMVEDRGFIYEWGQAKIVNAKGEVNGGSYFTIWRKQPDGHWKIFRNLVLP